MCVMGGGGHFSIVHDTLIMCVFGEGCFKYINKNVLILWDNIVSQAAVANMSITIEFSSPIVPVLQLVDVCYQNRHLFLAALQPYKSPCSR